MVKVGNTYTLVDNTYNTTSWNLTKQLYGNGDAWNYEYNEFDDLKKAYTTGGATGTLLEYFYNSEGDLARVEQYDTTVSGSSYTKVALVRTQRWYYDTMPISARHTVTQITLDGVDTIIEKDRTKTKSSYRTLPLVKPFEALLLRLKEGQKRDRRLCGRHTTPSTANISMSIRWVNW